MNKGRILRTDAKNGPGWSLLLAIDGERPFGYYILHFESLEGLTKTVMTFFVNSADFGAVAQFISEAQRLNDDAVPLPGESKKWLEFLHQNEGRLGERSRLLEPLSA